MTLVWVQVGAPCRWGGGNRVAASRAGLLWFGLVGWLCCFGLLGWFGGNGQLPSCGGGLDPLVARRIRMYRT